MCDSQMSVTVTLMGRTASVWSDILVYTIISSYIRIISLRLKISFKEYKIRFIGNGIQWSKIPGKYLFYTDYGHCDTVSLVNSSVASA